MSLIDIIESDLDQIWTTGNFASPCLGGFVNDTAAVKLTISYGTITNYEGYAAKTATITIREKEYQNLKVTDTITVTSKNEKWIVQTIAQADSHLTTAICVNDIRYLPRNF